MQVLAASFALGAAAAAAAGPPICPASAELEGACPQGVVLMQQRAETTRLGTLFSAPVAPIKEAQEVTQTAQQAALLTRLPASRLATLQSSAQVSTAKSSPPVAPATVMALPGSRLATLQSSAQTVLPTVAPTKAQMATPTQVYPMMATAMPSPSNIVALKSDLAASPPQDLLQRAKALGDNATAGGTNATAPAPPQELDRPGYSDDWVEEWHQGATRPPVAPRTEAPRLLFGAASRRCSRASSIIAAVAGFLLFDTSLRVPMLVAV